MIFLVFFLFIKSNAFIGSIYLWKKEKTQTKHKKIMAIWLYWNNCESMVRIQINRKQMSTFFHVDQPFSNFHQSGEHIWLQCGHSSGWSSSRPQTQSGGRRVSRGMFHWFQSRRRKGQQGAGNQYHWCIWEKKFENILTTKDSENFHKLLLNIIF